MLPTTVLTFIPITESVAIVTSVVGDLTNMNITAVMDMRYFLIVVCSHFYLPCSITSLFSNHRPGDAI